MMSGYETTALIYDDEVCERRALTLTAFSVRQEEEPRPAGADNGVVHLSTDVLTLTITHITCLDDWNTHTGHYMLK